MIDTRTYDYSESRWGDIFENLKRHGFDVYPPGVKIGDCMSPYIVIKLGTSTEHTSFSTNVNLYYVMCYVPKQSYSKLEPYVHSVMEAMKKLVPLILPYGERQTSYYDDAMQAHMVSITYKNYSKK